MIMYRVSSSNLTIIPIEIMSKNKRRVTYVSPWNNSKITELIMSPTHAFFNDRNSAYTWRLGKELKRISQLEDMLTQAQMNLHKLSESKRAGDDH